MSILTLLAAAATQPPEFVEQPCTDARLAEIARCGTVTVPENRDAPYRTIALNVTVFEATGPGPHAPPLFDIDGGPGLAVSMHADFYATFGSAYRARRDIVLVDQRGTGGSNPLHCPAISSPDATYTPLYPAEDVTACRTALESNSDLTQYGTDAAVADLDAVRASLGYDKIDLFSLSYGSTVALRYMHKHPQRVRAAVLMGVAPPSARVPSGHAPAGDETLAQLFDLCRGDPACGKAFDPRSDLARARTELAAIPGAPSEDVFMEKLRSLMYQPASARRIPLILNRAASGDLGPFYNATKARGPSPYAYGMGFSVVCPEGMGLLDLPAAMEAARETNFGDYRLRRQQVACSHWPSGEVSADFLDPVASDAAVLLVSGELDPVTPPRWADEVAATLPNSRHIVIPGSGHIFDGMSGVDTCLDLLLVRFLDTGDAAGVDASCIEAMKAPPFVTAEEVQPES